MSTTLQTTQSTPLHRRRSLHTWPCAPFPIRSERDHERAIAILDRLVPLDRPTRGERDFMDIMLAVVEAFEAQHHAIDTSEISPLQLLRSLIDDHGMSAADLGRLLGNRSLGGAILRGERELSKAHIKILAERFKLNPGAFI